MDEFDMIAVISAGSAEYNLEEAQIDIDEMIDQLERAKEEGCTHIVGLSGNYRGAQYVRLGDVQVRYGDEDGEY